MNEVTSQDILSDQEELDWHNVSQELDIIKTATFNHYLITIPEWMVMLVQWEIKIRLNKCNKVQLLCDFKLTPTYNIQRPGEGHILRSY